MSNAFLKGFGAELLKLAVATINPEPPEPNLPWEASSETRGIKQTVGLPSNVPTGHIGETGELYKGDPINEGRRTGEEQSGAIERS